MMCQFLVIAYVLLLSQNLSDKMRLLWFALLLVWMPVSVISTLWLCFDASFSKYIPYNLCFDASFSNYLPYDCVLMPVSVTIYLMVVF